LIKPIFIVLFLGILALSSANGQGRKNLENKRMRLLSEINTTSKLLNQTTNNKAATLDRYVTLQQQIQKREELIHTLQEELAFAIANIDRTKEVTEALEEDIKRLQEEYGVMARNAYRQKVNHSTLLFIFSSESFNQAFKRWQYLKQYDQYRKKQAKLIIETTNTLSKKLIQLEERIVEKEQLIADQETQTALLNKEMLDKYKMLNTLRADEARLRKDLKAKRIAHQKLNDAIETVIQQEVIAERKRARSAQALKKTQNQKPTKTPELNILTTSFYSNKGRLPWPVSNGIVTGYFGKQPHPTLRKIEITNNGIDIRTDNNAQVRAVFDGIVVGKQFIPGYEHMIIIQHGDYYTVYSNLKEVYVKKNDKVKIKQPIGQSSVNSKSNVSEVHFEVWREKERLNPLSWIAKR
jgi:septal ring factor EnvC (AmiA/AmiB activator)